MSNSTAEIIATAVKEKRTSFRKLANAISVDHSYLNTIARGKKPPPKNIKFFESLASALEIDISDFIEYKLLQIESALSNNNDLVDLIFETVTTNIKNQKLDLKVYSGVGISVNENEYRVYVDGELLNLTYKEFQLLAYLYNNPDRILTRDLILSNVWGYDYFGGTRTVDVHIRRLRSKIEPYHDNIETVRNIGYRFKK